MGDELRIGEVQWHCSDDDSGPDVGILVRISETQHLWAGELTSSDSDQPHGLKLYDPAGDVICPCGYEQARDLVERIASMLAASTKEADHG